MKQTAHWPLRNSLDGPARARPASIDANQR
jgi:hypothetical protein